MVVALVEQWQLGGRHAPSLLQDLQSRFRLPAMLVARDDSSWRNARAYAEFPSEQFLNALLALDDVDWSPAPAANEPSVTTRAQDLSA
ncbi:hypothetical protein [Massilia sp. DD77]|uniref:hypothetical protein n=1 Tax=Massilia sp. DD77 TaxID=3109349 RepID=UPI003000679F